MGVRIRFTGDAPKRRRAAGGWAKLWLSGRADGVPSSHLSRLGRAPWIPADAVDTALAGSDQLARMLHAWREDVESVPLSGGGGR